MALKNVAIEGNILTLELDEFEATIFSRSMPLAKGMISAMITMLATTIFGLASVSKEKADELVLRLGKGEDPVTIIKEMGIDIHHLGEKLDKIAWVSDEDRDKALGWNKQ